MAKKATTAKKPVAEVTATPVVKSTPVRNTPIPKVATAPVVKKAIGHGDIAKRAFEIAMSGTGGDELSNWLRAERELGL